MPSGRKKRNAAKRKMESLPDSSTPHGKAQGEKGGGEVVSPMSTEVGQFDEEREKETKISSVEGGGHDGTNETPKNGREVKPKEEKEDDKIKRSSSTSSSDSSAVMPISQPELVSVEHVEPEKEVEVGISEVEAMPVHVSDELEEPAGSIEQTVPLQEEEKEAATTVTNDVPVVEKVETSATKEPCLSAKEEKLVSLWSNVSAGLPTVATAENREIETQLVLPPQATIQRTSWLSCCGLFD